MQTKSLFFEQSRPFSLVTRSQHTQRISSFFTWTYERKILPSLSYSLSLSVAEIGTPKEDFPLTLHYTYCDFLLVRESVRVVK